jgi:hypothetical protein
MWGNENVRLSIVNPPTRACGSGYPQELAMFHLIKDNAMSLLKSQKVAGGNTEDVVGVITSIKELGNEVWDKEQKKMVPRNALAADLLIVYTVDGQPYVNSAYSRNVFSKGIPVIGMDGLKAKITLKENKDPKQPANIVDIHLDTAGMTDRDAMFYTTVIRANKQAFDV